jgi:nitrite reductase/ring-hydroxylating ferredoxin subunit
LRLSVEGVGSALNWTHVRRHGKRAAALPYVGMEASGPDSRRILLKTALTALCGAGLWFMNSLARRAGMIPENAETTLTVPIPAANEIRFYDRAIVVASSEGLEVFSSTCPHLGCRINRTEDREIVCPCHGSRFSERGELLHGPSRRALQSLPFEVDRANAMVRITLKNNERV